MTCLLTATDLVKHLGGNQVVKGVGFTVDSGQVLGLLGPNGAGKTTTIRMLYGLLQPDAGAISISGASNDLEAKRAIGVCTQDDTYDSDFSVRQNLLVAASYFRPRIEQVEQRCDMLLQRFGLQQFADRKPDTLSGGYKRRLMIARALIHEPRLLFLDEPTTGLDPQARTELWKLIDELRQEGLGIILTTHYMDEAEQLSDRLVVLQEGRVVAADTPSGVLGSLIGEQVLVVKESDAPAAFATWLATRAGPSPAPILGSWHIPISTKELGEFTSACEGCPFEIRQPTLDDLFLHLATGAGS